MLKELLRRPRATIPGLVNQETNAWFVPLAGFFFVSYAEGYERMITQLAELPSLMLVVIVALGVLLVGVWAWAGMFGGVLYLSARLFKGKPGFLDSVMAVGYGLFWPGLLGFGSALVVILGGYRGAEMPAISGAGALVQITAGFWGLYTVIAAIKAHHEFSWRRAIVTYFLPFVFLMIGVVAYLVIKGI